MTRFGSEHSTTVPKPMQPIYSEITALTDGCCLQHLNTEYADMTRNLTAALCRKKPSPLLKGKQNIWAAAILYTVGFANFLFDRSTTPHMTPQNLCDYFDVVLTTTSSKSKQIRDLFGIDRFEPKWTLPSRIGSNPLFWLIQVNGFHIDARSAPLDIQEEAFRRGLIPYLPTIK